MKLATIGLRGEAIATLVLDNGDHVDLRAEDATLPASVLDIVRQWSDVGPRLRRIAAAPSRIVPAGEIVLLPPIPEPPRDIICVGKNYHEHAQEFFASGFDSSAGGVAVPQFPVIFTKATTSVSADGAPIPLWRDRTNSVDYEGELGVVIGRDCFGVTRDNWRDVVFGYTIVNDVTSRELQKLHQQWFIGKGIDGFCPMGPWLVTADSFGEPGPQILETRVNGELRQKAPIADLIFDIPTLIETISAVITLKAGDIIATGTPAGVGIGFNPPRYLVDGDEVSVSITGLGSLSNTAQATPA